MECEMIENQIEELQLEKSDNNMLQKYVTMKTNECSVGSVEHLKSNANAYPNFVGQQKVDGVRIRAIKINNEVKLIGRSGKDYTKNFREVTEAIKNLKYTYAVLDGEMLTANSFVKTSGRCHITDKLKLKYK